MGEAETERVGWWRKHGLTATILVVAALVAFLIRTVWAYQLIQQCNIYFCFAGGSDSFYHARVMEYIIQNHSNLIRDPLLHYPVGAINPREPLFDWMNAILGILLAPFFGGSAIRAGMWVLEMQDPLWAALGVFPVYFLGREVSSRSMGLVAAVLYPFIVGNIESTVATYSNYLPFYGFFVVLTLALYIHSVKLSGTRRWVENYRSPRSIWHGFTQFLRVERNSVNWSIFTGVVLGASILAWQGYTYVIATIVIFYAITLIIERVRRVDSFGLFVSTLIVGFVGFPMAMPYYYVQQEFAFWFTVPLLIFFGGLLFTIPFLMLRDTPWVVSVPVLFGSIAGAGGLLYVYNKGYFNAVLTGQGYFVKTLIYSTVAEAQAPSFDALIVSYGVVTFFLAFVGLAFFLAYLYSFRFRREHIFMVVFGLLGIYLPVSAAKFFLLGSPVFALLPAEVLVFALGRMGYPQLRRNIVSLGSQGGWWSAFRRSVKVRHLVVVFIVIGVILPNAWYAVDAGIPYNVKSQYNQQIVDTIPSFLQPSAANQSGYYLGAAGIQTDTPQQYDEAGYNWFATQDTQLPPAQRPAFISWWDYGFQAVDEGQHPTVADNFQEGIDPAGNFLLAQNESLAIGVLATDLLYSEEHVTGLPYLPAGLNERLAADGVNLTLLHTYLANNSQDVGIVLAHPSIYGQFDPSHLDAENAMYDVVSNYLASTLSENGVVRVYQDVQTYTGWSIRYAMVDSRLFPTSGSNTGIYYAPADLTDRVISPGGVPTQYFQVYVTGSNGNTYPLGGQPSTVQVGNPQIVYYAPFYNSMIYRIFVGYNGTDVGAGSGIPGLSPGLSTSNPEPGWMLQHFVLAYRTAYWCPYTDYQAHPNCFVPVNLNTALDYQKANNGTADTSPQQYYSAGETFLEYYPGATIQGQVVSSTGVPAPGVRVTVLDSWGIPHMTTVTGPDGRYSLLAPPGNVTLVASYGALQGLTQTGANVLTEVNMTVPSYLAETYGSPPLEVPIVLKTGSVSGTIYWNLANSPTYSSTVDEVIPGINVTLSNGLGLTYRTVTDASGTYDLTGVTPGSYNVTLRLGTISFPQSPVSVGTGAAVTQNEGLTPAHVAGAVQYGNGRPAAGVTVTLTPLSTAGPPSTVTTNGAGNFTVSPILPGNYSAVALGPNGYSSAPQTVSLLKEGQNATLSLTLSLPVEVRMVVLYQGRPVPNIPVRFDPIPNAPNATAVFLTNGSGVVTARLGLGNWSVYAMGAENGTWLAGIGNVALDRAPGQFVIPPLSLEPAQVLSGVTSLAGTSTGSPGVLLTLETATGATLTALSNATGAYSLYVPSGTYSLLATYDAQSPSLAQAALAALDVLGPTHLDLSLTRAITFSGTTGYLTHSGTFLTVPRVSLAIRESPDGATLRMVSGLNGSFSYVLPATNATFTIQAERTGFFSSSYGPLDESGLLGLGRISLTPRPILLNVTVTGVPPTETVPPELNFTTSSPGGTNTTASGTFVSVSLTPGVYQISGWAPSVSGSGVFRPLANVTLSLPPGNGPTQLTLSFLAQHPYHATFTFPNATAAGRSAAEVQLISANASLVLNGSQLAAGFTAPAGNYTLWITAHNGTSQYSFLGRVLLTSQDTMVPDNFSLTAAGTLRVVLMTPQGNVLNASVPFQVEGPNSSLLSLNTSSAGVGTLVLPLDLPVSVTLNATLLRSVQGVLRYETFTTPTGISCVANTTSPATCSIPLQETQSRTLLRIRLSQGGAISSANGTLYLNELGSPANATVSIGIREGSVTIPVYPGLYTMEAVVDPQGVPAANLTTLTVPYNATGDNVTMALSPGWVDTLTFSAPPGVSVPSSLLVNVTIPGTAASLGFSGVPVDAPYALVLPQGTWAVNASATVPMTVPVQGTATVTIVAGNVATQMPLVPQYVRTASLTLVGQQSVTASVGSNVTFNLVLRNTGNTPFRVRLAGSPSTLKISFQPSVVTLGTGLSNSTAEVEATLVVPVGTMVNHAPLVFQALLNGTQRILANATPGPQVNILPIHALNVGETDSSNIVGSGLLEVGFHVGAAGNTPENVTVVVANEAALVQDGWSVSLETLQGKALGSSLILSPGQPPTQGIVKLTARTSAPVPPGSVLIQVQDRTFPGASRSVSLSLPTSAAMGIPSISPVTGPAVGTPQSPSWLPTLYLILVFVPGAAIVAGAGTYRWWKTRRWVRR